MATGARGCRVREHVDSIIGESGFLTLPAAPREAPGLQSCGPELEEFRVRALALTSIAGLCGMPQVSVPVATLPEGPVGMGIIGPRGSDEALLVLTEKLATVLEL